MHFRMLCVVALFSLTSCANLSLNDVYRQPTFQYQKTSISDVSFSELSGTSVIRVQNSNPYALPVNSLRAELWLEGKPWLELDNSALSRGLPANNSINVSLNWALVFEQLLQRTSTVYQQGEADFTLRLEPTFNVPVLGPQTLSWTSDFTVPVPKLPSVSLASWSVESVSFSQINLSLGIKVQNPNVFGINTRGLGLGVSQNGRSLTKLALSDASIASGATSTQQVALSLSIADVGLTLARALQQGRWPSAFEMNWQGNWQSPDLDFALPSLAGTVLEE